MGSNKRTIPIREKSPFGFSIPPLFTVESYESAIGYKPRPDDLFIVTYPKCGTTWTQNIVHCLLKEGRPPFDSAVEFFFDSPFIELLGAESVENMKRPGTIKSHLPFHLIPWSPEAKYIYVARNPKDCLVSFYHHTRNFDSYDFKDGAFSDYFELFLQGDVDFGDYFDILLSWYEHKNKPNVLFITYEDMKKDTRGSILKIAEFMGPKYKEMLQNEDVMENVILYSSVKFMKENLNRKVAELAGMKFEEDSKVPEKLRQIQKLFSPNPDSTNYVRKGIVGDWKTMLSDEQNQRLEKRFQEKTKGTDLCDLWKDVM